MAHARPSSGSRRGMPVTSAMVVLAAGALAAPALAAPVVEPAPTNVAAPLALPVAAPLAPEPPVAADSVPTDGYPAFRAYPESEPRDIELAPPPPVVAPPAPGPTLPQPDGVEGPPVVAAPAPATPSQPPRAEPAPPSVAPPRAAPDAGADRPDVDPPAPTAPPPDQPAVPDPPPDVPDPAPSPGRVDPPPSEPEPEEPEPAPIWATTVEEHRSDLLAAWASRPEAGDPIADAAAAAGTWWALRSACVEYGEPACDDQVEALLVELALPQPDIERWGELPGELRELAHRATRAALGLEEGAPPPQQLPAEVVARPRSSGGRRRPARDVGASGRGRP